MWFSEGKDHPCQLSKICRGWLDVVCLKNSLSAEEEEEEEEEEEKDMEGETTVEVKFAESQLKKKKLSLGEGSGTVTGKAAASGGGGGAAVVAPPCCLVENCEADLSCCKKYHQRHRVCEVHAKAPVVLVDGLRQRFCQQCSRSLVHSPLR